MSWCSPSSSWPWCTAPLWCSVGLGGTSPATEPGGGETASGRPDSRLEILRTLRARFLAGSRSPKARNQQVTATSPSRLRDCEPRPVTGQGQQGRASSGTGLGIGPVTEQWHLDRGGIGSGIPATSPDAEDLGRGAVDAIFAVALTEQNGTRRLPDQCAAGQSDERG